MTNWSLVGKMRVSEMRVSEMSLNHMHIARDVDGN